jgi:hypothetical protein
LDEARLRTPAEPAGPAQGSVRAPAGPAERAEPVRGSDRDRRNRRFLADPQHDHVSRDIARCPASGSTRFWRTHWQSEPSDPIQKIGPNSGRCSLGPYAAALVHEIWGLGRACPRGRPQPDSVACDVASRTPGNELDRRLVPGTGGAPRDASGNHVTRGGAVTSPLKRPAGQRCLCPCRWRHAHNFIA